MPRIKRPRVPDRRSASLVEQQRVSAELHQEVDGRAVRNFGRFHQRRHAALGLTFDKGLDRVDDAAFSRLFTGYLLLQVVEQVHAEPHAKLVARGGRMVKAVAPVSIDFGQIWLQLFNGFHDR